MKKKFLNIFTCVLMAILFVISPLEVHASSKSQYYAAVLFDYSGYKLSYTIYQDGGEKLASVAKYSSSQAFQYKEEHFDDSFLLSYKGFETDDVPSGVVIGGEKSLINRTYLAFPGYHPLDTFGVYVTDYDQANDVIGGLISSINSAIAYVGRYGLNDGRIVVSTDISLPTIAIDIARNTKKAAGGKTSASLTNAENIEILSYQSVVNKANSDNEYKASFKKVKEEIEGIVNHANGSYRQGITLNDFVVIWEKNGEAEPLVAMWKCPKGYSPGQYKYSKERSEVKIGSDDVSWTGLVTYANSAAGEGLFADTDGWSEFVTMGKLEKYIAEFASSITNKGAKMLGLNTVEELAFNREGRGSNYYLGMMPYMWFQVSNALFWVFQVIAVFVLLASILWAVYKQNYAVISPSERINLQDHIANLLISIFLLMVYVPIFYILAKTNQMIVSMFDTMTAGKTLTTSVSLGWLVALVFSIFNLVILAKLNITYLIRAATITLLHIISPLVISSMSISGSKRGSLFNTWFREMVSAIFMQSFDAVVLALFIMISSYGGVTNTWESLMLMFMLIPLNNWFKEKITGTSGIINTAKQVGSDLGSRAGALVGGVATVAATASSAGRAEKEAESKNPYIEGSTNSGSRKGSTTVKQSGDGMSKGGYVAPEGSNEEQKNEQNSGDRKNSSNTVADTSTQSAGDNGNNSTAKSSSKNETKRTTQYEKDRTATHAINTAKTAGALTGVAVGSIIGGNVGGAISNASTKLYNPTAFDRSKYENAYNAVEQTGNEWDNENHDWLYNDEISGSKWDNDKAVLDEKEGEANKEYEERENFFKNNMENLIPQNVEEQFSQEEQVDKDILGDSNIKASEAFMYKTEGEQRSELFKENLAYYKSMNYDESLAVKMASLDTSKTMNKIYDYPKKGEKGVRKEDVDYSKIREDRIKTRTETAQNNYIKSAIREDRNNVLFEKGATVKDVRAGKGLNSKENHINEKTEKYKTDALKYDRQDYIKKQEQELRPTETRDEHIRSRIKSEAIEKHDKYAEQIEKERNSNN